MIPYSIQFTNSLIPGNGEMQLLETEFSTTLTDLIDAYLSDADSIPAFLASVTMDLFNKQTIA